MLSGWILDLYPNPDGMVLWLIGREGNRWRLLDPSFAPRFYAHGPEPRLAALAQALARK